MKFEQVLEGCLNDFSEGLCTKEEALKTTMEAFIESHKKALHIITKARNLRSNQKEYFKTKRPSVLEECKRLESEFDKLIKAEPAPKQKQLFN